jgi:hypothetical protein
MSSGAGRATAREIKQAVPKRQRLRDMLSASMIDAVVVDERIACAADLYLHSTSEIAQAGSALDVS